MSDLTATLPKTECWTGIDPDNIPYQELMARQKPVIMKGVAAHWPLAEAGSASDDAAMEYLLGFYQGKPVVSYRAAASTGGRYHYNHDLTGFNFERERLTLNACFEQIRKGFGDPEADLYYIGSTDVDGYLPGFRLQNDLHLNHRMFAGRRPVVSIWLGNGTTAACHHDMSNNLACCLVGRRRFTLFPPEQVANLYPGPLEPTPGGQVISMVDFRDPDFERYPDFRMALEAGQVAELSPGDVLFYPALWWHSVEALGPFNAMVNYWWNDCPDHLDTPQNTLLHAMLSLRDRPEDEKRGWRALFDYYVFGPGDRPARHLPEHARGELGKMDEQTARRLRAKLLQRFNR